MTDLSGIVSGLSGRIDTLYNNYSYVNQQLLQRPDLSDFSSFRVVWNSQLQSLADSVSRLQNSIAVVQNLIINLSLSVSDHYSDYTGYTGVGISSDDLTLTRRSLSINSPTEDDESTILRANRDHTLQSVYSIINGTAGSSVYWNIYTDASRTGNGSPLLDGILTTDSSSGVTTTSFSETSIDSGNFIWLVVTGVNGVVDELFLTITLT